MGLHELSSTFTSRGFIIEAHYTIAMQLARGLLRRQPVIAAVAAQQQQQRPARSGGGTSSSSGNYSTRNSRPSSRPPGGNSSRPSSSRPSSSPAHAGSREQQQRRQQQQPGWQPEQPPRRARDVLLKPRSKQQEQGSEAQQRQQQQHFPSPPPPPFALAAPDDATFIPRDPAVQDGPWSAVDARLVVAAQQDAAAAAAAAPAADDADLQGCVLLGQSPAELGALAERLGQPRFRGQQMADSLLRGARSVAELKGLPAAFREELARRGVRTGRSVVHHSVKAADGTQKLLLQLADGRMIETVGIPVEDERARQRLTVCVSSQVGCPMRCTFCSTGMGGFARNLQAHEIVDQVLTVSEVYGQRATNIVFMGMGEPLLNIQAVVAAAAAMREQLGISGRAITVSTVGLPNAIPRLAEHQLTATLAVSIHAPNQQLREQLIPSAKVYPLHTLMRDCSNYFKATGRRVTFEYTLLGGVNDATAHAEELAALLKRYRLMSHVNLIPWNPVDESSYQRPDSKAVRRFEAALKEGGVPVSIRATRGLAEAAACGMLRSAYQKTPVANPQPLT